MGVSIPAARMVAPAPGAEGRTIPFDYAFRFDLEGLAEAGRPGKAHTKTVVVSIEGPFTAVAIGYGVAAEANLVEFGPPPPDPSLFFFGGGTGPLADLRFEGILQGLATALGERGKSPGADIGPRTAAALANGIRLSPRFATNALLDGGTATLDLSLLGKLFQVVPLPADDVQFLYTIRDEGSGREFQSEPILNTAGLGAADGDRPFRQFAYPMRFEPRTTIRMDVTELSSFRGLLHVSLHGYKTLGTGAPRAAAVPRPPLTRGRRAR